MEAIVLEEASVGVAFEPVLELLVFVVVVVGFVVLFIVLDDDDDVDVVDDDSTISTGRLRFVDTVTADSEDDNVATVASFVTPTPEGSFDASLLPFLFAVISLPMLSVVVVAMKLPPLPVLFDAPAKLAGSFSLKYNDGVVCFDLPTLRE